MDAATITHLLQSHASGDEDALENRSHFLAIASKVMNNIFVDYTVKKKAEKRENLSGLCLERQILLRNENQ